MGKLSPVIEPRQAQIAKAAKSAGVNHAVWSTLEDSRDFVSPSDDRMPTLMGRFKIPHFAKREANSIFRALGVPTTFLHTSFYWENLVRFGMGPRRDSKGRLTFLFPMANNPLPGIAASDIGSCALALFRRGGEFIGQEIGIAGEHLTGRQMANAMSDWIGEPVVHVDIGTADYAKLGDRGADDSSIWT